MGLERQQSLPHESRRLRLRRLRFLLCRLLHFLVSLRSDVSTLPPLTTWLYRSTAECSCHTKERIVLQRTINRFRFENGIMTPSNTITTLR